MPPEVYFTPAVKSIFQRAYPQAGIQLIASLFDGGESLDPADVERVLGHVGKSGKESYRMAADLAHVFVIVPNAILERDDVEDKGGLSPLVCCAVIYISPADRIDAVPDLLGVVDDD